MASLCADVVGPEYSRVRGSHHSTPGVPTTPRRGLSSNVRPAASIVATVTRQRTEAARESIPSQGRHNSRSGMARDLNAQQHTNHNTH
jgi:hypothetical protein